MWTEIAVLLGMFVVFLIILKVADRGRSVDIDSVRARTRNRLK